MYVPKEPLKVRPLGVDQLDVLLAKLLIVDNPFGGRLFGVLLLLLLSR